jgi:hypothetical protein
VRAWLWRVLLADGTRALTTTGRWRQALAHIEEHRGIGTRMLDGRQVAVVTALTENDTEHAFDLLADTAPGEAWEQAVTQTLTALYLQSAGRTADAYLDHLAHVCLAQPAEPGMTGFYARLGLTALNVVVSADHPSARRLAHDLARRTAEAVDGSTARELLADGDFVRLAEADHVRNCRDLVRACGLGTRGLSAKHAGMLSTGMDSSELVITRSLPATESRNG